jgi:hypothetical protein
MIHPTLSLEVMRSTVPVFIAYNNQQRILLVRCAGTKSLQQPSPWQQEQWDKLSPWVVLFGKPHPSLGDDVAGLWICRSQQKFNLTIVVSNGINEQVVHTLTSQQEHGMLPPAYGSAWDCWNFIVPNLVVQTPKHQTFKRSTRRLHSMLQLVALANRKLLQNYLVYLWFSTIRPTPKVSEGAKKSKSGSTRNIENSSWLAAQARVYNSEARSS